MIKRFGIYIMLIKLGCKVNAFSRVYRNLKIRNCFVLTILFASSLTSMYYNEYVLHPICLLEHGPPSDNLPESRKET